MQGFVRRDAGLAHPPFTPERPVNNSSHLIQRLNSATESTWLQLGTLAEKQGELDKAVFALTKALYFNHTNTKALIQLASIYRKREQFQKAIECLQTILGLDNKNGEVWGALGHCNLMLDEYKTAFDAYQQALLHLPNPRDPSLWYGIGLLYDRCGCLEQAEGAFKGVLKMDPDFEKKNDIYFQLGMIFKQSKFRQALECFRHIVHNPPPPLTESEVWFHVGQCHEYLNENEEAVKAYERVTKECQYYSKVLQRLGWLYQDTDSEEIKERGHNLVIQSIQFDHTDGHGWWMLGRIYMQQHKHRRSYDAFQQAIYRDPNNAVFWCCIGALYFVMNQHRDALHAYIRAIRLNPCLFEGWYNLGVLYEACDQPQDALDAYRKANELDGSFDVEDRLKRVRQALQGNPQVNLSQSAPILPDPGKQPPKPTRQPTPLPDLMIHQTTPGR